MEAIFRKTLLIRVETAKEMGAAKASNLTSVGVKNIVTNVSALHEVWTVVLMTGIGLYIIWTQIGLSFLASVGRAVVFVSLLPLLSKDIGAARTHWADSTDRRVKFISSVLPHSSRGSCRSSKSPSPPTGSTTFSHSSRWPRSPSSASSPKTVAEPSQPPGSSPSSRLYYLSRCRCSCLGSRGVDRERIA
jgi:hypothetical protein